VRVGSRRLRRFSRRRVAASLARNAVAGIVPGDHVCASFGSDDEHQAIVACYARQALRRNSRFLYFAHRSDDTAIRAHLAEEGIDVEAGLALGQIEIRRIEHDQDTIDPDAIIASLQADRLAARRDGYAALCGAAEMSWALTRPAEIGAVVRYEQEVARAFATGDLCGLCLYDRRLFAPEALDQLVSTHEFHLCTGPGMATATRRQLTVSEHDNGMLVLAGELDIDASAYLAARIAAIDGEGDFVVLTSALEFADVSGCRALVRASEALRPHRRLVLPEAAPHLLQVLELCGWSPDGRLTPA
jgi:anti-anti-sigma regulatory factor